MKKPVATILILVYLASSFGITINSHYCMKKLVSVHMFETQTDHCGQCGMEMHEANGCCQDVTKAVKLEQDQVTNPVLVALEGPAPVFNEQFYNDLMASLLLNGGVQRRYQNHSPPLLSEQDTHVRNNVFRI
ncbi:MAG: HYC_CC_PP family protein [Chitinophagaceae bacterium]